MTIGMNDAIYDDIAIERACEQQFGLKVTIAEVIARDVACGVAARATLFRAGQNAHFLYITSPTSQLLADAMKIVRNMNMVAEEFLPPHGDDEYFVRYGTERFKQMFPGKHITSREDTRYYETLANYNPALVRIAKVKGSIHGYVIASRQWRKVQDYAYVKMKVS